MAVLVCWAALCTVLFAASLHHVAAAAERPNVLFLVVDDLRPKLGCYGESMMATPNIDQLAAKSIKFQRAYIQEATCSPSRTSFLTGRRPDTTRVFDLKSYFRKVGGNYTTLPQHFKDHGYITQSSGKIFHPGSASGDTDDYPFSWTYPAFHAPTEIFTRDKICPGPDGKLTHSAVCPVDLKKVPGGSLPDIQNTDFTIDFLKNRSRDHKPFFMAMGYHRPHLPFAVPKKYMDLYPLNKIPLAPNPYYPPWLPPVAWSSYKELRHYDDIKALNVSFPFGPVPLQYQYKLIQGYSAAVSYTDAQVGRVLQALDQLGFANNTIISLLGDHGWQLGEHGEWTKHTNFDMSVRVPMMINVPGVTAKQASRGQHFPFQDAFSNDGRRTASKRRPADLYQERDVLDTSLKFHPEEKEGEEKVEEEEKKNDDGLSSDALVEAVDPYSTLSEKEVQEKKEEEENDDGLSSDALVEAVDLYSTLSELAGLKVPALCPDKPFKVKFCTEGASLVPIIKNLTATAAASSDSDVTTPLTWKTAVFSQYPRPKLHPEFEDEDAREDDVFGDEEEEENPSASKLPGIGFPFNTTASHSGSSGNSSSSSRTPTPIAGRTPIRIMGYTMRTVGQRYTEWIKYDLKTFTPHWDTVYARELYVYSSDPDEDLNVAAVPAFQNLVKSLSARLRAGWRHALPPTLGRHRA